ncbi:MAG: LytTR family transcriptional regulator, partial [Bacteroidota bacterium]
MKKLNTSYAHHLAIGALILVWGLLFAYFTRPFEHGVMDEQKWVSVSLGFSFLAFFSYLLTSFLQKFLYEKKNSWNIYFEIGVYLFFYG